MLRQTFRRHPVMAENVVQVAMVEMIVDIALQRRKLVIVAHETMLVQRFARQFDLNDVIMAVQTVALVIRRQAFQLVRGGKVKFLGDAEHQRTSCAA